MTIGKKIGAGFALPLVTLIIFGVLSYQSTRNLVANNQSVTESNAVLANLEDIFSMMKDIQRGARGYVITGEDDYLEPYHSGIARVPQEVADLRRSTVKDQTQQKSLDELERLIEDARSELQRFVSVRKEEGGFEPAVAAVKEGKGNEAMNKIRTVIDKMKEGENQSLMNRTKKAEASAVTTMYTIGMGTPLAVLIVSVGGFFISRSISNPIREAVGRLSSTSAEILAGTTQQAAGAQEQAAAVTETMTTVDEVTQTSEQGAQRAKGVGETVQRTMEVGQAGRKAVEESIAATNKVKEQVESTAENILLLAEQAQSIGEIIATVNDIAEQTNLLALNAAIEASRAGEHGKGFSVVASEVKALADQSKKATGQVRQILGEIQKATNTAVLSTEEVTKGVATAMRVAGQTGETIEVLASTLSDAARTASQIVASAGQQAAGMGQIHQAMRNIDQVTKQNLTATRQAEQAARDLNVLGAQLAALVGK
jgi:methyl-accepting chemotaxis protein